MDVAERFDETVRPHARGLILAVVGATARDAAIADQIMAEALQLGVDPLDYCAHRLKLGDVAYERAAHWAGFGIRRSFPGASPACSPSRGSTFSPR